MNFSGSDEGAFSAKLKKLELSLAVPQNCQFIKLSSLWTSPGFELLTLYFAEYKEVEDEENIEPYAIDSGT